VTPTNIAYQKAIIKFFTDKTYKNSSVGNTKGSQLHQRGKQKQIFEV
jgi:hypothetical protein